MTDLRTISATELAQRIREGKTSARQAVALHIEQIERVNPHINAVVRTRFDEALAEADAADRVLAEANDINRLPPLLGVPCTVKESFAVKGMPQTAGLVARKGYLSQSDATTVQRLKQAGAIIMGVTNTSELCMWIESNNRVYGRSNNPYDVRRIVGGSSGGEGAIIGAGASVFGLGSDIGGSIRGPAFFNGVFGHKPTGGLVPKSGQFPDDDDSNHRFLCTGPLCRRAEDLMPLLQIMAGPDGIDPMCELYGSLGDPREVKLASRKLISIEGNGVYPVAPELLEAQRRAAQHLVAQGMELRVLQLPALRKQFDIWSAMLGLASSTTFGTLLGSGEPVKVGREVAKWAFGRSDHTWMALALAAIDPIPRRFRSVALKMRELGLQLKQELDALLLDGAVLLYPSYDTTAPKHSHPARGATLMHMPWSYQAIMNVMELPSTQVPLGLDSAGLPLGVQVVASRFQDHLSIAVACELERAFGGWQPPALAGVAAGAKARASVSVQAQAS